MTATSLANYPVAYRDNGEPIRHPDDLRPGEVFPFEWFEPRHQDLILEEAYEDKCPPRYRRTWWGELPSRAWWEWHTLRGHDVTTRRESIPPALRAAVLRRDGRVCGLCRGVIGPDQALHIDHIHPVSLGGRNELKNLQPAHSTCNLKKGNRVA